MKRVAPAIVLGMLGLPLVAARPPAPPSAPAAPSRPLRGTAGLRGRVLAESGRPLRHARVQALSDRDSPPVVLTDAEGRFSITGLPAGQYRVLAGKPGFVSTAYGARRARDPGASVTLADRGTVDGLEIRLPAASAISGRILDSQGSPAIGLRVAAELPEGGGAPPLDRRTGSPGTTVATTRTDDRGEFRLGGLPEGRYLIAVDATTILLGPDGHPLDGPIPLTTMIDGRPLTFASDTASPVTRLYFPGTTTFADAQPIAVAKGEERTSVDVLVPAAVAPMTVNQLIADRAAADRGVPESYRASIRGRIVTADGRPLPQTRVSASSDDYPGRLTPSATTDADGRYELTRLPAGRYRVAASHAGYLTVAYGQQVPDDDSETVLLAAGASRDRVDITLQRPGIIAGRVVDDAGDPVEGAYIRVLRTKYESGQRRFVEVVGEGLHRTDDQGRYRVYGLRPGDYRVSAIAGQVVPLQAAADVPGYAPTYFPGTADPAGARVLSVDLDQQMLGVDIVLAARPTARVSGTALDADGKPVEGGMVLMPSRRSGALAPVPFDARTSSDGSFEFPNVPPGDYVLQVSKMRPNSYTEGEFAVRFVRVDGGDVDGLAVRTTKGSRVTGRIALDGTASPDFFGAIDLRAVPIDPDRSPLAGHLPVSADLARDLTFRMAGLSGPRVFRLRDAPRGWMLKAVLLNGRDIVDTPTDFGADEQSIADLEVVLSQQGAEIAGTVADNRGRPLSGRTVVVFSADRQLWTPPSRYVASAKSGRNGGFLLPALPAGEYRAAAVDRLGDGDWQDPDVLARFAAEAVRFAASPGQRVAVLLSPLGR